VKAVTAVDGSKVMIIRLKGTEARDFYLF
jgi:hypothetical protein